MAMRPVLIQSEEKVFTRHDKNVTLFQTRIEFACGNLQAPQPDPVKKGPFAGVQRPVNLSFGEEFS